MARLFSDSCGSLPVLLLLASAPVMASWESAVEVLGEHLLEWAEKKTTPDAMREYFLGRAEKLTPHALREMNAPEDFIKGVKWGFKTCKILKKLQRLIEKQNPGGGTTTYAAAVVLPTLLMANITATDHGHCGPKVAVGLERLGPGPRVSSSWAVVGFGNGSQLSKTFPKLSYQVAADGRAVVWLPTTAALPQQGRHTIPLHTNPKYPRDGRYYVEVTGILVGDKVVRTSTKLGFRPDGTGGGVYLSITEPYTYLERGVYLRLKVVLMSQIKKLNPGAVPTQSSGKLCYARTELTMVPSMAILFAGGNAVMKLGPATNVWYREGPATVCLAILPTNLSSPGQASVLGRRLQSGRVMTIDVTPGTPGSLTF